MEEYSQSIYYAAEYAEHPPRCILTPHIQLLSSDVRESVRPVSVGMIDYPVFLLLVYSVKEYYTREHSRTGPVDTMISQVDQLLVLSKYPAWLVLSMDLVVSVIEGL